MPIAAIPTYLVKDFSEASPGMRFGLLLPVWTDRRDQEADVNARAQKKSREGQKVADMLQRQGMDATIRALVQAQRNPLPGLWDKNDFAARDAWTKIRMLSVADRNCMKALAERQTNLATGCAKHGILRLEAQATAPFTTGLGNEHPLENGFAFLNPYGLPYLPGSGVKGVLRQAARELASGQWGEKKGWSDEQRYYIEIGVGKERRKIALSMLDALFGRETETGDTDHVRGALTFWDVIPRIEGNSLMVEIMTPHQGHYYQQKLDHKTGESTSPHESGQPTPISFLTVPPGSGFTFHVTCDAAQLEREHLAPELAAPGENGRPRWHKLIEAAFEHAFDWLGFGAKTAVGYGTMKKGAGSEAEAERQRQDEEAQRQVEREDARRARLAALSPQLRQVEEFEDKAKARKAQLGLARERPNTGIHTLAQQLAKSALEGADWSAEEKRALVEALETWLPQLVEGLDRKDDWKKARKKLKLAVLKGEA